MRLRILSFLVFFISIASVVAQKTTLTVRAKAKDAKFIGTSIGGAKIIIKNAQTHEILAEGVTSGSTGNTEQIMKSAHERNEKLTDENTAGFTTELDIKEPVFVTVEAYAPQLKKQATVLSTTQLWLLPGKDITGEGLVLEIPGFVVDILSPQTHERIGTNTEIELKANLVMMCGCPTEPGGIWNSDDYEITALLTSEDGSVKEVKLNYADKQSTFSAKTSLAKGYYKLSVYAFHAETGNTGMDQSSFIVN